MIKSDKAVELRGQNIDEIKKLQIRIDEEERLGTHIGRDRPTLLQVLQLELGWKNELLFDLIVFLESDPTRAKICDFLNKIKVKPSKDNRDIVLSDYASKLLEV